MACRSCGGGQMPVYRPRVGPPTDGPPGPPPNPNAVPTAVGANILKNLATAVASQDNKLKWFRDGVSGLVKAVVGTDSYPDDVIKANRAVCEGCEFATAKNANGKLTILSQCMGKDPDTGEVCGCSLLSKSMVGSCPLKLWPAQLTISAPKGS